MNPHRRAFTIIDLAAAFAATVVVAGVAGGLIGTPGPEQPGGSLPTARAKARQLKDATQVRGLCQALVIWAQNNKDYYPRPSQLDGDNTTVAEKSAAKDTTANIFSILIYNGFISTELCISPAEKNPRIKSDEKYKFIQPKRALKPDLALWDPAFSADFTNNKVGNLSYAHLQPSGKRLPRWSTTFNASEPVLATRGPEISAVAYDADKAATVTFANPESVTMRLFGGGKHWSGNVAFNDAHVEFVSNKISPGSTFTGDTAPHYVNADGAKRLDTWCYDEPDDAEHANNYLGIFTKAGETPKDFAAVWD